MTFPIFGLLLRRGIPNQTRRVPTLALALIALFLTSSLIGCGARINTAGQTSTSTQSYTLTVTGTATDSKGSTLAHSANIVLKMNSPQKPRRLKIWADRSQCQKDSHAREEDQGHANARLSIHLRH